MSNKYTEGAASVLLHLHPAAEKNLHAQHAAPGKPGHCPECGASADEIVTNELPGHHIEFTCRCMKCGFEWMPNSDE